MNKKEKLVGKKVLQIIRSRMTPLKPKYKKFVSSKINYFLKNNSTGILILSDFDDNGQTDLKLSIIRTHENHSKETFKKLFEEEPKIKETIREIFEEEQKQYKKDNLTLRGVA